MALKKHQRDSKTFYPLIEVIHHRQQKILTNNYTSIGHGIHLLCVYLLVNLCYNEYNKSFLLNPSISFELRC